MTQTPTREIGVTELVLRDGHQSLLATRMALEDMVAGLRGHRPGRLLERRVLGRGHLRLLHPLPQRGPLGAAAHLPQADAQLPPPDAAARPEPAGLPPLRGHGRRPLRGQVGRERHGRLPRLRRAQRRPQPPPALDAVRRTGKHAEGTICYTTSPAAHRREVRRDGRAAQGHGLRLDLHQGHGRAAAAPAGLRHRPRRSRRSAARTRWSTSTSLDHRRHDGQPDEGDRGRRRHRRHVDLLAQPGPRPQPDRGPGRDARGHRLHHPAGQGPAAQDQGPLRQGPPPLRRVRVEVHRRRDRDLRQPDPRRHDLEHGEPAQAAGGRRPGQGGARRGAEGARRTPATRRWSRRRARSSARRPSSTS